MELRAVARALESDQLESVAGLTFESLLFLLEQHQGGCCVAAASHYVESAALVLQERVGEDVGCIVPNQKGAIESIDQHYFTSSVSIQAVAAQPKSITLLFIEDSLLNKPLFSIEQKDGFNISKKTTFDNLLSALSLLGFSKTKGSLLPGTFCLRGGVLDLFLFNVNKIYRISFLEKLCRIFSINKHNNLINKELGSLVLFPKIEKNKVSLVELPGTCFTYYKYRGGILKKEKILDHKKSLNLNCLAVDYQCFIKNKKGFPLVVLTSLFESGFKYKKTFYVPGWFTKQYSKEGAKSSVLSFDVFGVLEIGGTYIHDDFGFCCFLGFETTEKSERVCLKFADGIVKLDVHYMPKLSFVSLDNKKLSFLNKPAVWNRKKNIVKKGAEDFVGSLVEAYSKREGASSISFNIKDSLISDFVRSFPYQDTLDQRLCWKEILKDLGSSSPMNRLICGDVGFGKTELAVRAAFVSVLNNQQTVVIAPTTILANQLYHCFISRLDGFGVVVGCLSRITVNKKNVVSSFIKKRVDVLIGTSALLFQKNILKQCGLFIVDEEHRFGVKNKEIIFQYNPGINFLSLSATPIPRSMQLSLSGVRNFSLIQTAPIARKPIISSLNYFSQNLIKSIILKEISRGGQVYFVDNSVNNLKKTFKKISLSLPFIKLDLIYGGLDGKCLIKSMDSFVQGKTQVLFSTTIIESGIDIGSTNTIIINNAHLFGLSQLYQLRGRVGRSSAQAFAWFLFPEKKPITKTGLSRLKTIIKHSSLGAGYQVALSDLEIRGAGSLFGYSQSGGASVGFEYYARLLSLAIHKIKNSAPKECFVDLLKPSIPRSFLSSEKERAFYYKKIFSSTSVSDLKKIKQDLISLFGVCINEIQLLIQNKTLALLGAEKNVSRISKKGDVVSVYFAIQKKDLIIDNVVAFIVSFFTKQKLSFWFVKSHKNLIFQYKSLEKDDYILLLSFINKMPFF